MDVEPIQPKIHVSIQNNFGPNFGDGVNFVTCEQTLALIDVRTYLVIDDEPLVGDAEVCVEDETQGVGLDARQRACLR